MSILALPARGVSRLALLSLLALGPAHGYGLREVMESWRMDAWANVSYGSIYQVLARMAREGLVEEVETVKDGPRPARTVYRITEEGRDELRRLLRQAWSTPAPYVEAVDIALSFAPLGFLGGDEVAALLAERLGRVREARAELEREEVAVLDRFNDAGFRTAVADHFDHFHRLLAAEQEWTERVLAHARAGRYRPGGA